MNLHRARIEAGSLLALSLLLLLLLVQRRDAPSSTELEQRTENLLPVFRPMDLREVTLDRAGAVAPVVLRRDPDSPDIRAFSLTYSAGTVPADEAAISGLLSNLEHAPLLRRIEGGSPSDFGFSAPELELKLEMGQLSLRVLFGKEAASPKGAHYALVSVTGREDVIGVVPGSVLEALERDGQTFLGKLVFRYAQGRTARLVAIQQQQTLELVRDDIGFRLGHGGPRADRARVDGLFFQLARTSLDPFTEIPGPGVFAEVASVQQYPTEGEPLRVLLAETCPKDPSQVWLHRTSPDPVAGCAPRPLPTDLNEADFVSRRLAPVFEDEVDHVVLDWSGARLDLVRQGKEFLLQAPEEKVVPLERGREYLERLLGLRLTEAELGPAAPIGTLRISALPPHTSHAHWLEIDLFPGTEGEFALARRKDDGMVLALPQTAVDVLDPRRGWFANKLVLELVPETVERISLERDGKGEELVKEGDRFHLANGHPADEVLTEQLLDALREVQAVRFMPQVSLSPADARLTVEVTRRDGSRLGLLIGKRTHLGYLARTLAEERTFLIAPELERTLRVSLRSRRPAQLRSASLSALRLEAFGSTLEFEREGDHLVSLQAALPDHGKAIEEAIDGLEVVSALPKKEFGAKSVELRLGARFQDPAEPPRELCFGEVFAGAGQSLQRVQVAGVDDDFAFTRSSVQRLLDLL